MVDLVLNEERLQYRDLARDFSQNEITARAARIDDSGEFPLELIKKAWEIGLFNVRVAPELGGLGLGIWDAAIMSEEIGANSAALASIMWGCDLAVTALLDAGSESQKQQWLEPIMGEFGLAAAALDCISGSEGSLVYSEKPSGFTLNGSATLINARHGKWLLVIAHDSDSASKSTAFILSTTTPGLSLTNIPMLGLKGADLTTASFRNIEVNPANVLGTTGGGSELAAHVVASVAPIQAASIVGLMRNALENAVRYSKERHSMGQPIGNHQAVGFMLADLARDVESARLMSWKAACLFDNGHPNVELSAMSRTFACDAAMRGTTDAVQVYGGYGYSREYPVERLMRDAKTLQTLVGGGATQKVRLGRQLLASC